MDIAALNVKIMFQKSETVVDGIGNHKTVWKDYFSCHATVSGEGGTENAVAGQTVENVDIQFTVRFCNAVNAVTPTGYRIVFQEELYNILSIDHLRFKRNALKFKCEKVRR